jgi:O-antigen/teichoic acid export membrane protein
LNIWFSAVQAVFSSVLVAHERFDLTRGVDLFVLAVRTAGTIFALTSGYGIGGLAAAVILSHFLGLVGNFWLAHKIHPQLRTRPLILARARVRELLGYGSAAFITAISFRLIGQTDLVIAGAAIGVASVTIYSVGGMLVFYSSGFLTQISSTLFPAIQRAAARGELGSSRWLFLRAGRLGMMFGLLAYIGMIVFSESFIRLWMYGPEFGDDAVRLAGLIMSLLSAAKLLLLFVGASNVVLNAKGYVRFTATLVAMEALANIACSLVYVLIFEWGIIGIALGTLTARLLFGTFNAPIRACKLLDIGWWSYVRKQGGPGIVTGVCFAVICLTIRETIPGTSWPWFISQVSIATAAYSILAYWTLVSPIDRSRAWRVLRNGLLTQDAT